MEQGLTYEEYLERYPRLVRTNVGVSMLPLLRQGRDLFIVEKRGPDRLKAGDVVLYRRPPAQYVLHRIVEVREKDYVIAGDNCWQREIIPHGQVVGIAVRFYRGGRWHEVTDPGYRLYARVWTDLFYVRRPFLWLRDKAAALLRRLRNRVRKRT